MNLFGVVGGADDACRPFERPHDRFEWAAMPPGG